jgi:hypothetical protein
MRGAFVVQLQNTNLDDQLEGLVEEVDSGLQARFRSDAELLSFLRERFARIQKTHDESEGQNEGKDNHPRIGERNT